MRPPASYRYLFALGIAAVTAFGSALQAHAAGLMLPDGTLRYEFGRRPTPVLTCQPHYVCDITLDTGENVLNMAIGDSTRWVIAGGQSGPGGTIPHVFVKPNALGLETNLMITTTKRVYDISLRSAADAKHPRISFFYADEDAAAKAVTADHERAAIDRVLTGTPLVPAEQADTKYKLSGDQGLEPDKVFNDGVRTFMEWKTLPNELPSVAVIDKNGTPERTNFRVVGNAYIVDNVYPNFDIVLAAGTDRHGRPERRASVRHL